MADLPIANMRMNYRGRRLVEQDVPPQPLTLFQAWFDEARATPEIMEANAMTLATSTPDGRPSARMVLLKGADERGFAFFSNYESRKAQELDNNPWAALCFWWGPLHRQIRIEGSVERLSAAESDTYFQSRPLGSQLAAIVSAQSRVIANRQDLEQRWEELTAQYTEASGNLPARPAYWGGYLLRPDVIEFWQGGPSRLHDRLRYSRQEAGDWVIERLSP